MALTFLQSFHGKIICLSIQGTLLGSVDFETIMEEIFRLVHRHQAERVLIDLREMQGRPDLGQTFYHVRHGPRAFPMPRYALLEHPSQEKYAQFFQSTAHNAGRTIHAFLDWDEAMAWLASEGG